MSDLKVHQASPVPPARLYQTLYLSTGPACPTCKGDLKRATADAGLETPWRCGNGHVFSEAVLVQLQ